MYTNKTAIGGFAISQLSVFYWSSSEVGSSEENLGPYAAWFQCFDDGFPYGGQYDYAAKEDAFYVRAIRAF